jgi:hypothetical protein
MLKRSITAWLLVAVMLLSVVLAAARPGAVRSAPEPRITTQAVAYQTLPDWMPPETAAQLDIGIDVLVPLSIPAPFAGVPQVSASSGYYSLYWFVGGGTPTLLQITGTAGGDIPAYSKYDRNVQLTANSSVNGATAYRDLTPIYDLVYWKVGNVVYSVESQNSSVDSLTIANGLTVLAVPASSSPRTATVFSPDQITAGDVGNVTVSVSGDATLSTDVGYFTANGQSSISVSGDETVEWQAPTLTDPVTATFQVIDPSDGSVLASTPTQIVVSQSTSTEWGLECPPSGVAGDVVTVTASGSQRATLSASDGSFTGGSPAIVLNLDGSTDVDFTMPFDGGTTARLTLSDGESAVATCEIEVVAQDNAEPTATATKTPKGVFPGDATDLSIPTGKDPALPKDFGTPTPVATVDPSKLPGDGTGIVEAGQVTPPNVPPTATPTKTPKPGEPTSTPVPTETPVPTLTPTPENPMPTMVPQVGNEGRLVALEMGPAGGSLNSPYGVQIVVPENTFSDTTSVTLQPVADNQVPLQAGVSLVPESAYEISFAKLNGRGINLGDKEVTVRVDLGERWADGATLFQLVNGQATPLRNVKVDGTALEGKINGPTRVVAGVPTAQIAGGSRSLVPIVIVALVAVILLIVAGSILISLRNRRPRTVATRRTLGSRGRF